jgi:nucleoside-diphosphate-sugar epimerase
MNESHVLIVGCGYVGRRLAHRLQSDYRVNATTRSAERAVELKRDGIHATVLDLDRLHISSPLPERLDQAAIVYLAPPPASGESDLRLDRFFQIATVPPQAFVYISTTGVYGDTKGQLVDESTPVRPATDRARRRVSAEEMVRVWCTERHVRRIVLRVPGIYGPGRLPLERLRNAEPTLRDEDAGVTNRIHVDDLVAACIAAIKNREARGVYNVTDGTAHTSTQFLDRVAALAQLPPAPRVSMDEAQLTFSPERLSFLNESRRISNERMLINLGVRLRYPQMDEGIRQALEEERQQATRQR